MNIGAGLKAHLVADAGVNAIVAGRVYPNRVPRTESAVLPLIWYQCSDRFLSDVSEDTYTEAEIDIFCAAESYDDVHVLADAVESALHGFQGQLAGIGPHVRHLLKTSRDDSELVVSEDDTFDLVVARFSAMWQE